MSSRTRTRERVPRTEHGRDHHCAVVFGGLRGRDGTGREHLLQCRDAFGQIRRRKHSFDASEHGSAHSKR